ncbi:Y-family DNA polymerase [Deinococcus altitudinis]|uniref:Y-family DNA polymerase n=1 Tax=Deinococcus altitudinis TaxID=468914 RepID=UPI0038918445
MARGSVLCVLMTPWPLHLLEQRHPGLPLAVLDEHTRRVLHINAQAREAGVSVGVRESAALSLCPELHAEVVNAPVATTAWNDLLETLHTRTSDRVEARAPGVAFVTGSAAAAREISVALRAQVGIAASQEVAHFAALRACPGTVKELGPALEKDYLPLSMTEHLHVLGLTKDQVAHLLFLGVRGLADLMRWSAAQRQAFLGVETGKRVNRFLKGERTTAVSRYTPLTTAEGRLGFDDPLMEAGEVEAALADLVPPLYEELRGRTAAYLTVHADTLGGRLSSTRKLKWPIQESGIRRLALRMLVDGEGEPLKLGLDALSVSFSGLQQPSRQIGLWPGPGELDVVSEVLDRFPSAFVRLEWRNPHALTAGQQYVWVDWLTGAERVRPMDPRPLVEEEAVPVRKEGAAVTALVSVPLFGASD